MTKLLETARELVKMLEEQVKDTKVRLSECEPGQIIVSNGNKYKVLKHLGDGTTLIIPMILMLENEQFDKNTRNYKESNLKKKIETECLPVLEEDFGADNLVEHEVDLTSVDMQNEFGTCRCKARPITFDEARKHNDLLVEKNLPDWWWTCTPWSTEERGWSSSLAVVSPGGDVGRSNCFSNCGVRPVCILKSNIFVSKGE